MNLPATELDVVCEGLRLHAGACVPASPRGTVLLLHGIPSVAPPDPDDEGYPGLAQRFAAAGWLAAWVEMRGVRGSEGFFSIDGWVRDARAAIDAAQRLPGAPSAPVAAVASSAGGAVAIEAARRGARLDALALLAAPAEWLSFAADPTAGSRFIVEESGMPLAPEVVADPRAWAAEFERVMPEASIRDLDLPILIVHGTTDDVVPVEHARRLADAAPHAEIAIIEGAGHQLRRDERALESVLAWLERLAP